MPRKCLNLLACLFLLCAPHALSAAPQETGNPGSLPAQLPVYIVDFSQDLRRPELAREIGYLGPFTGGLIHLRLLEIPSLTVHLVQSAPSCGDSTSPAPEQRQANNPQRLSASAAPPGDFYIVHGSIETPMPDIVLNYFVDKCEGHKSIKVFQDTQPFTLDHALEEITVAAHAIAFKIERSIPPTRVTVELFQSESDPSEKKDVQAAIQREVIDRKSVV